ncbi:MAG: DHHW family protein [Eubacteriales bacterium]
MRTRELVFLLALGFVIAFFSFSYIFCEEKSFSEDENRVLQGFPAFTVHKVIDGRFSAQLHGYFSDQIALRSEIVELKALSELALGKRESNGILLADGGYLVETHRYTDENYSFLEINLSKIEKLRSKLDQKGIRTASALVPRKVDVLGTVLPDIYPREQNERVWSLALGRGHTDLRGVLSGEDGTFYKTDHHWTARGAYLAYCALGEKLGYVPRSEEDFALTTLSNSFYGTTYSGSGFFFSSPDEIKAPDIPQGVYTTEIVDTGASFDGLYDLSFLGKKDKYSVFLGGNSAHVRIKSSEECIEKKETLLIVKDSFSHSLAPYLTAHFDIELIDPRYFHGSIEEYATEHNIENVLFIFGVDTLATAELRIS